MKNNWIYTFVFSGAFFSTALLISCAGDSSSLNESERQNEIRKKDVETLPDLTGTYGFHEGADYNELKIHDPGSGGPLKFSLLAGMDENGDFVRLDGGVLKYMGSRKWGYAFEGCFLEFSLRETDFQIRYKNGKADCVGGLKLSFEGLYKKESSEDPVFEYE